MRLTRVGIVLLIVMVICFVYGFLSRGHTAGYALIIASLILLLVAIESFSRGGRAEYKRQARLRERENK